MKQITKRFFTLATLLVLTLSEVCAQDIKQVLHHNPADEQVSPSYNASSAKLLQTNCTDKINYVGNQSPYFVQLGGVMNSIQRVDGLYQVFPSYKGNVIAVEFDASKYAQTLNNPVVYVRIFDVNSSGVALWNVPLTGGYPVSITGTGISSYTLTFPSPVPITGNYGFAVGLVNWTNSDSAKINLGPINTNPTVYSYLTVPINNITYPFPQYFGNNSNILVRPIVTTSVNAQWSSAQTSTGCGVPVVYEFNNTSPSPSSYVYNQKISPLGITSVLDFGDNSPVISNFTWPETHSYTAVGNYTAAFTLTYNGWTNNCVETLTQAIVVENPTPAFTYTVNGFTVTFNNTSPSNFLSFKWNFGDLSTSTQTQPGSHTFSSPGTYVVELEGTAACGKVKKTVSIIVTDVGISQAGNADASVFIYPNPVKRILYVTTGNAEHPAFEIFNAIGSRVKELPAAGIPGSKTELNVGDLPEGIYFLKIHTNAGIQVRSFVKE